MRFSITTVLLAATVIAAPVPSVDQTAESISIRGLLSLLPRYPAPPPLRPPPTAPKAPITPPATKPPTKKPGTKDPNEPDAPASPPRLGTDPPNAKPKPAPACSLKRGTDGCLPGADPKLDIDGKYDRTWENLPNGPDLPYLKAYSDGPWGQLSTKNTQDDMLALRDKWADDMVAKGQANNKQDAENKIEDQLAEVTKGEHSEFFKTSHRMKKGDGVMRIQASYNREFDLRRPFNGEGNNGEVYSRPGTAPDGDESPNWTGMALDNLKVASAKSKTSPSDLRHVARDNIETEEVQNKLNAMLGDATQKTFTKNDPEFAEIQKNTLHGGTTESLVKAINKQKGPKDPTLETTQYTVYKDPRSGRLDMMIDLAPI